jgi:phenylacetate-CoA ligase
MMNLLDLYARLPHRLQEVAVTLRGVQIIRSRYGRGYQDILASLLRTQWADAGFWEQLQLERLKRIVREARTHVPFYRDRAEPPASSASCAEILATMPLLPKQTVRERQGDFHHEHLRKLPTVVLRTSGTTGAPMKVFEALDAHRTRWAAMERLWRWAGVRYGDRRLSFTGNRVITHHSPHGPFGQYDRINKRMLMSAYHLGSATVDRYLDEIARFQPAFMDGYPSAMFFLAQRAITTGRDIAIQACFPTAETLSPEQREVIEQGFRTRVFNQYGSAEGAAVITECPAGSLHVCPEVGIVEILSPDGQPTPPGAVGDLVLTGLNNIAMPLLRYQIGDRARVADPFLRCPCGRRMPVVAEIIGRQDDVVATRDGRRIGMLSFNVFKWTTGIQESQIVQESVDHFVVRIVPAEGYTERQSETVAKVLKELVGSEVRVDVQICDSLPRSNGGKLRAVISKVA